MMRQKMVFAVCLYGYPDPDRPDIIGLNTYLANVVRTILVSHAQNEVVAIILLGGVTQAGRPSEGRANLHYFTDHLNFFSPFITNQIPILLEEDGITSEENLYYLAQQLKEKGLANHHLIVICDRVSRLKVWLIARRYLRGVAKSWSVWGFDRFGVHPKSRSLYQLKVTLKYLLRPQLIDKQVRALKH